MVAPELKGDHPYHPWLRSTCSVSLSFFPFLPPPPPTLSPHVLLSLLSSSFMSSVVSFLSSPSRLFLAQAHHRARSTKMPSSQRYKRRCVACQHFPDDQTLRLQAGAGEDDAIHLPSSPDRVDCERQEEEEEIPRLSVSLLL